MASKYFANAFVYVSMVLSPSIGFPSTSLIIDGNDFSGIKMGPADPALQGARFFGDAKITPY